MNIAIFMNLTMYQYFSKNGEILPHKQAMIALSNIEYTYGFGVYETIRVSKGVVFYLGEHMERLMESARIIGLEHNFSAATVGDWVQDLVKKNEVDVSNVKILLIGGSGSDSAAEATLYIECLPPLFPDRKLYSQGAAVLSVQGERIFPHAKTLNMLASYLAYKEAKKNGCYDALFVDRNGNITEGTRTNFFVMKGKTIYSPPEKDILLGVTRSHILQVAAESGFTVEEKEIPLADVAQYDAAFISSTSTKIMPLKKIDAVEYSEISPELRELMTAYDMFHESYKANAQ